VRALQASTTQQRGSGMLERGGGEGGEMIMITGKVKAKKQGWHNNCVKLVGARKRHYNH